MSVEICSTVIGACSIKVGGENEVVSFEDRGGIGYAKVTHEQAEQFLKIKDSFWKPGQRNTGDAVAVALASDPEAAAAAAKLLAGGNDEPQIKTVAAMVELIKLATTEEELAAIVGEDTRAGVLTAISKRRAQINKQ